MKEVIYIWSLVIKLESRVIRTDKPLYRATKTDSLIKTEMITKLIIAKLKV